MDLQKFTDALGAQWQMERSQSQMTLGEMVSALLSYPAEMAVAGMSASAISYRGYYCDIAFKPGYSTVEELLDEAQAAIGKEFEGYKGGDFLMGKSTPVWVSDYGTCSNLRLMRFKEQDGNLLPVLEAEPE